MTFEKKILPLRKKINDFDKEIINLISQRLLVVKDVGNLKEEYNIPPLQPSR
jgi:chorismate mutase